MDSYQIDHNEDARLKMAIFTATHDFFKAVVDLDSIMAEDLAQDIRHVRSVSIDGKYVLMASRENIWIGVANERDYIRKIKRDQYPYTTLLNTYLKETVLRDFDDICRRDRSR